MIPETDRTILGSLSRAARRGTLDPERLAHRAYEMGSANCHQTISRSFALPETLNLNELEKAALEKALRVAGGSIPAAAQMFGIGKTTAYRKAKQYGLAARLPRLNPITEREASPSLAVTSGSVSFPPQ